MVTKNLIISVELRKGGVGKTTAALTLAKIYLDKKYRVLFLDLDLTGTNIIDQIGKLYWEKSSHILEMNIKEEKINIQIR
jgi:cellulose biosynthesis protein BcsQ